MKLVPSHGLAPPPTEHCFHLFFSTPAGFSSSGECSSTHRWNIWSAFSSEVPVWDSSRPGYKTEGRSAAQTNPATQLVPPPMEGFLDQFAHSADLVPPNSNLGELELETLAETE